MRDTELISVCAVCLCVVTSVNAFAVLSAGTCPDMPVKQNFNITAYEGAWYSYENFDAPYQFGMSCVTANYKLRPDGTIQVVNEGFRDIRVFGMSLYRRDVRAEGKAQVLDWSNPAKLRVMFGDQPDLSIGSVKPNYMVVDTDYVSYSLVYSCSSLFIPFKIEGAWILTRVRGARPKNVFELENMLKSRDINIRKFKMVDHRNC